MSKVPGLQDEPPRRLTRRTTARRHGVHIDDDAAAYALGALEPADEAQIERHLQRCQRCARLVEAHRQPVRFLPFLAPPVSPRPEAKAALFARIAATPAAGIPLTATHPHSPLATLPPSRPAPIGRSNATVGNDAGKSRKKRLSAPLTIRPYMIAPLVLALALVGFWAFDLGMSHLSDPQQESARQLSESVFISTSLNADTGGGEETLGDGHAISNALPNTADAPISHDSRAPTSRIGDGLLSATGLRVDVGQSPLPSSPLSVNPLLLTTGAPA